jgi:hypothetical protein
MINLILDQFCSLFYYAAWGKVIRIIEQNCNSFLWNGISDYCGSKSNIGKVTFLKQEGGLGLRMIEEWNIAYIMIFIWSFFSSIKILMGCMDSIYMLKGESLREVKISQDYYWA